MSRATQSKSRADKKGDKSAPTPAVTHEIVPGKYTDVDWKPFRLLHHQNPSTFYILNKMSARAKLRRLRVAVYAVFAVVLFSHKNMKVAMQRSTSQSSRRSNSRRRPRSSSSLTDSDSRSSPGSSYQRADVASKKHSSSISFIKKERRGRGSAHHYSSDSLVKRPEGLGKVIVSDFHDLVRKRKAVQKYLAQQRRKASVAVYQSRMLELDDGEDFIGEVVEEVVSGAISIIYDKYIQKQLLPYTVSQAKDALLTIIDWRFLACDPGEGDVTIDNTWQEDEEPTPSIPDCWAQGSVPKTFAPARPLSVASMKEDSSSLVNEPIAEEPQQREIDLEEQPQPWVVKDEDLLADEATIPKEEVEDPKAMEPTPPSGAKNKRKKFRPHKGRLQSAGVSNMCESLTETECRLTTEQRMKEEMPDESLAQTASKFVAMPKSVGSILKHSAGKQSHSSKSTSAAGSVENRQFQAGRPPGSRDVYYDEHGNVIAMSKINPDKLPTHRIKTKFHVVDPAVEAAQARLDAMRTGRFTTSKAKKAQAPISEKAKLDKSSILDLRSLNSRGTAPRRNRQAAGHPMATSFDNSVTPLPPPMIESMELAPGVVVREGDRVKKGPRQVMRTADKLPRKDVLRPVGVEPDMTISVQELLGSKAPMVRLEPTPVPPIINKHINNAQKMVS